MKVCIFTETYYPVMGGGETQAQLLAEGLIAHGHSVILLTRQTDAALKKKERLGSVNVYRLAPSGKGHLKKWGLLLSSLPKLIQLRHRYELIFVSGYGVIGLTAVLVGKLLGKPVVLKADSQGEMSGDFFEDGLKQFGFSHTSLPFRLFLGFRNAILKKADAFSAISSDIASEWISSGVQENKIFQIPNSVDTNRFVPAVSAQKGILRQKIGLSRTATIVVYTGRLVSYKGLPLLLKVWKEICHRYEQVLLLLVGAGGFDIHNCEEELRQFVISSGLENYVLFTGPVQNVPEYLQASDIFVFPTQNEAFGTSLVEAMACGLPVITTPVGAIKAIVSNEENGLLIPPGDFEKLLIALERLIQDQSLASRLGQAAHKSVQGVYAAETVTQSYLALFDRLLPRAKELPVAGKGSTHF